jgi:RNA polymerase-binding transcription factor DksA
MAARSTTAKKAAAGTRKSTTTKAGRASASGKKAPVKKANAKKTPAKTPARANAKSPAKKAPTKPAAKKAAGRSAATAPARSPAKKAAPAPAKPKKSPFPAKFLAQQEEALRSERATYTRQAKSLRAEADSLVADFEPGDVQFDEESGEGDTLNIERERDLTLSAQAQHAVEEIDHALGKFANGTYGLCEVSGEPIPKERLEAIPWARERVEYKIGGLGRR